MASQAQAGKAWGKGGKKKDGDTGSVVSNTAPTISGAPGASVTQDNLYVYRPTAADADGDSLTFSVQNRPLWASFDSGTGKLSGTPGNNHVGTYGSITIVVSDGSASASIGPFSIEVVDANDAPSISGSPPGDVAVGSPFSFRPSAADPDGDSLSFNIANRPNWASFDSSTGRLSGTPGAGDVGSYDNILVSVSDGSLTTALPAFSITVNGIEVTGAYELFLSNLPDRSGAAAFDGSSVKGNVYVFTGPDSSVQKVEFFIDNVSAQGSAIKTENNAPYDLGGSAPDDTALPFDTTQLTDGVHTLTAALSLADGSSQLVTAAFTVTNNDGTSGQTGAVSLDWVAPTARSDGTPLTVSELAGYNVRYGSAPGQYVNSIGVDNPSTTTLTVTDLPVGTYYFVVTARDLQGRESAYSNPAQKQAQ